MTTEEYLSQLIAGARAAQAEFSTYSQEKVNAAVRAVGKAVYDNAELLARMAVDETGMGRYEDKVQKCRGKSKSVWYRIKDAKSRGIIERNDLDGIVKVAKPIGVIGAITPTTNPVITPMHNSMMALKGGNAIIICPHPRAKKCGAKTVALINEALAALGMPAHLIQYIEEPSLELSAGVMRMADACISTGGAAMVKSAYSSGKPAYGVGAGNVQCLVDRDVDFAEVAPMIVAGRIFDNGILCTCEQSIHCPREKCGEMVKALTDNGAYYISDDAQAEALRNAAFPDGMLNKDFVGASVEKIARMAGLDIPEGVKTIVCKTKGIAYDDVLAKEKMFPVLALFPYDTWEEGVANAQANLAMEGMGHSVVLHSHDDSHIEYATGIINVSRYLVNQVGSTGLGGAFDNGLNPTTTLGCGTWGNNSISENLWFYHLINISRIAYRIPDTRIPTDEEIWG